jgi:ABC-type multidrug transport system fused ATPase/permease subunit
MSSLKDSFLIDIVIRVKRILPKQYLKRGYIISGLLLVSSVLELIGLAALIPVFGTIFDDNFLDNYVWARSIYDFFELTSEKQFIILVSVGLVLTILIKNILLTLINYKQNKFVFEMYQNISERLHRVYFQRGSQFLKSTNSNILQRDLITAPSQFSSGIILMLIALTNEFIIVGILITGIFIYDVKISLLLLFTVVPITFYFYKKAKKSIKGVNDQTKIVVPDLNKQIFESIYGFQDIRILGVQEFFFSKIKGPQIKMVNINITKGVFSYIPTRIIETGLMLSIALIVIYGIYYFDSKQEIVSIIGIFAIAGYRILPSLNRILTSILSIQAVHYTIDIIEQISEYRAPIDVITDNSFNDFSQITLNNISFHYPENKALILNNISMDIQRGDIIGIIGKSGAGKSTLMNILLTYLEPTSGDMLVDKTRLSNKNSSEFLGVLGYVAQDVYIIDDSLKNNIAFGIEESQIDLQLLEHVIKVSQLTDFANDLSLGVESSIGERGASISGGQRQRVGIARALYSGAKILLFDEATSALDTQTEVDITNSIFNLKKENITSIIIAHRHSSLKHCNKVFEVENGYMSSVSTSSIS